MAKHQCHECNDLGYMRIQVNGLVAYQPCEFCSDSRPDKKGDKYDTGEENGPRKSSHRENTDYRDEYLG
jgi:hypothetical protein